MNINRSESISQLHQGMGLNEPRHPLITVIDTANLAYGEELLGLKFSSDLYCIALKDSGCGIDYGRNQYEFSEGSMFFTAPKQVFTVTKTQEVNQVKGWMLYFHPDLIADAPLGKEIDRYSFFDYELHDALQLSEQEQLVLESAVNLIKNEISVPPDTHTRCVLISGIELILNYCLRFYQRQLKLQAKQNVDVISKVETLIKAFYKNNKLIETGPPTLQYLADKCHLSPAYLSDLLSKETGRSAKEHINGFLVEKAKHLLLSTDSSISEIAYSLGFNYPHYFGRLFKQKTGKTPQQYRNSD